jgi:succinyl-diaminopimelate desuccinylase
MDLDAFLATALDLLALPSTADRPDDLQRAADLVVDHVGPGFAVERFCANGKPSALVYHQREPVAVRPTFTVVLNAHVDVVPADPHQFAPRIEGDRLYARGAQDMKVTALLQARAFRELAATLPYPLALQIVADEEVGGRDGTLHQLEQGVRATFAIIGEHSGLNIVADSKGLLHAKLHATGRSGHGAYPWLGDNALTKIMATVVRLMSVYPAPDTEMWRTTVNLAHVATPNLAINQVPASAEAWLDIRFPAEDTNLTGRSVGELREYLQGFCEPGVTVEIEKVNAPHHADHDRPEIRLLREAAQEQGYPAEFLYKHGSGDGAHLSAYGVAAVAFGVGGAGQHGPDEYADIATITPYYRALTSFLRALATLGA